MRADLNRVREWIKPGSRVLDLGCGDGTLMANLQRTRQVTGYGLENDTLKLAACIANGVNVIQADMNEGLAEYFDDDSFDYVVMSLALQATLRPDEMLVEMLRVGKEAIVTFPNHGYWKNRWQFAFGGMMPVTRTLPDTWYNTANTHLCTVRDFEVLCANKDIEILRREMVDSTHQQDGLMARFPNLFGEIATYHLTREH